MLDPAIADQLRKRGYDVESIQADHDWLQGRDDSVVLEEAGKMLRALVTDNVMHFLPLHEAFQAEHRAHCGLLLASSRTYPRSRRTVGIWIRGLEQVLSKHATDESTPNLVEWLPSGGQ
jgi:hypothetical protein